MFKYATAFQFDITWWNCSNVRCGIHETGIFFGATAWNDKFRLKDGNVDTVAPDGNPSRWQLK